MRMWEQISVSFKSKERARFMSRSLITALVLLLVPSWAAAVMPESVEQVLNRHQLGSGQVSVLVQRVGDGETILELAPDRLRNPASVTKLPVTFAALEILGPTHTWRTEIYAENEPRDGVLDGNLWLRGTGDPYLVTEQFWKLVGGIRRAGVEHITGDLVLDVSHFALEPEDPGAFDDRPDRAYNQAPHALLVNFNAVRFQIDSDGNGQARVSTDPPLPELRINNRLQRSSGGCGAHRGMSYRVSGDLEVSLEGEHPGGCRGFNLLRVAMSPEDFAHQLFSGLWRQWGGEFRGGWRRDIWTGSQRPLYTHRSPPLSELIRPANKFSNNVMTRHFKLAVAAEVHGEPATTKGGNQAIIDFYAERGVNTDGMIMDNAAGLSRTNRFTARQVAEILQLAQRSPFGAEFRSSLALSGLDGTMRRRFSDGPERGRMHLKTGTLNHVSAVAGYVRSRSDQDYVVVVLINGENVHWGPGRAVQDSVLAWVYQQ